MDFFFLNIVPQEIKVRGREGIFFLAIKRIGNIQTAYLGQRLFEKTHFEKGIKSIDKGVEWDNAPEGGSQTDSEKIPTPSGEAGIRS